MSIEKKALYSSPKEFIVILIKMHDMQKLIKLTISGGGLVRL
jgi:hypothetical protein